MEKQGNCILENKQFNMRILAARNLRGRPFRNFCIVALVAVFCISLSAVTQLSSALSNGIESVSARLGADIMIVPVGYEAQTEGTLLRGEPSAFFIDGATAKKLEAEEGLARVTPQLFIASLDSDHCAFPVQLIGYDEATDFVIKPWIAGQVSGRLSFGEIVVGNNILADEGEELMFFSKTYHVVAKLEKTGMGFDTSVFLNMETAQDALNEYIYYTGVDAVADGDTVSVLLADVNPGINLQEFGNKLHEKYYREGITFVRTGDVIEDTTQQMTAFLSALKGMVAVLWAIVVVTLILLFSAILAERKREFGVYRVLGASSRKLVRIILSETALVSLIGAGAGLAIFAIVFFPFGQAIDMLLGLPQRPDLLNTLLLLAAAFAVSFVIGPVASLVAALRIGKVADDAILRGGL
jgi:putative ABC transport system permease protein